jgi:hypothetical protein
MPKISGPIEYRVKMFMKTVGWMRLKNMLFDRKHSPHEQNKFYVTLNMIEENVIEPDR